LIELAELIGCSSQNAAAEHVKALKKKGYISIAPGAARGITVVKTELDADPVAIIKGLLSGGDMARDNAVEWLKKQGVTMKLVLPFPPSVNTYWRAPNKGPLKGRHLISEKGRAYQSAACAAIIEQLRCLPKPSSSPAAVEILLFPRCSPSGYRQLQQGSV
jgi:repressor LexA